MSTADLIATLEEGVREGRIAPYLADYIAAQELKVTADEVGYTEWGVREREAGGDSREAGLRDHAN
jgi:hypothetical protein